nr:insulinase family protein [uncultured Actinoplanes sp.]
MIEQLEVDGVPVLLAPGTGQIRAGLAFRVGFADEPLARRGITHLVEHLALHSAGIADYHYNGATGVEFTFFHMQGSEQDVATFLSGVCASLRELPMHRMATEKDLLRAEANGRGGGVAEDLPMWRHGARDYGMPSYPEWGLPAITEQDLRAWVAHFFTRENAVLWVSGERVPEGLELDLPSGARRPLPTPSSALPVTPAYFPGPGGVLVWDAVVPRGTAASVFTDVLERELRRELRQDGGLSYTVRTDYEPLGVAQAVVTAVADALPEKQGALVGGFTDVLAAMRVGRVDESDVAAVIKQRTEALEEAAGRGALVPGQAFNLLLGLPVQDVAEVIAETRAVTAADVAAVAAAASASGLIRAPQSRADWAGCTAAPASSATVVTGTPYASLDHPHHRLVIGADGVSLIDEDSVATVRFDACSIVLAWPDGARQFVGHDAVVVTVEPSLFAGAYQALPWLDARIPSALRVDQPPRDPSRVPAPRPPSSPGASQSRIPAILGLVVLIPLTLFFAVLVLVLVISLASGAHDPLTEGFLLVVCAALTALGGFGIHRCLRRAYRR